MEHKKYIEDLTEIKNLMQRSSRFLSLSGLSGIMAGLYAIAGALIGYFFFFPENGHTLTLGSWNFIMILALLFGVAVLSVVTAYLLTKKKAKNNKEKIWDDTTKRLLFHFLVPMLSGGIFIIIKLTSQHYGLTASLMLLFYGLALMNASKYTRSNVQYLGLAQIVLGLFCAALPGYGFLFWVIGFGVLHIIYGSLIYFREERA